MATALIRYIMSMKRSFHNKFWRRLSYEYFDLGITIYGITQELK